MSVMLRRVRVSSSRARSTRRHSSHRRGGTPAAATKTALRCDGDRPTPDASSRRPTSDSISASMRSITRRTRQSQARSTEARPGVRSSRAFARKSATPSVTTALSVASRQARLPADASFQRWLRMALTFRSSAWPACSTEVKRGRPRLRVFEDRAQQVRLRLELAEHMVIEHGDRPRAIISGHDELARTECCVLDHAGAEIGAPEPAEASHLGDRQPRHACACHDCCGFLTSTISMVSKKCPARRKGRNRGAKYCREMLGVIWLVIVTLLDRRATWF